jgi:hypothetical protein
MEGIGWRDACRVPPPREMMLLPRISFQAFAWRSLCKDLRRSRVDWLSSSWSLVDVNPLLPSCHMSDALGFISILFPSRFDVLHCSAA